MSTLLEQLDWLLQSDRPVCYTALIETRGSTPQKSGATMLVMHDGKQMGTLGGGCVEAEVKQRALAMLYEAARPTGAHDPNQSNHSNGELLTFSLDNDYGWDDGLICGGRMTMLVVPLFPGDDVTYFQKLRDFLAEGRGCTEVVILNSSNGEGVNAADQFLVDSDGHVVSVRSTANSALSTEQLAANLRPLSQRPRPYISAGLSFLPHLQRCRLIIVGAGHVGQKVAELAADVEFDVWVVDDRQDYCHPDRFPSARRLIVDQFDAALQKVLVDSDTYCIIVTRGHNHDEQALHKLVQTPARYLGMIGSRRKIKLIFDDLIREGIPKEMLQRVYAPLGYEIGSQTVSEIAISIVAELIAHRNLGTLPLRTRAASVLDSPSDQNANSGTVPS